MLCFKDLRMTKQQKFSKKELDKRFEELLENETRYGIIMAIRTFGSLNIKMLSRLMGKTVSTIHHHLEEMKREPAVITIDTEKTNLSRGKYYTFTDLTRTRYPKDKDTVFEEEIPTILNRVVNLSDEELAKIMMFRILSQPDLGSIAKSIRRSLSYSHNIETFIVNSFERAEEALQRGLKPKNLLYPFGTSTKLSIDLKVSKLRHALELGTVVNNFFAQLVKAKQKIEKEMDKDKIPEEDRIRVHYQLFGGEVEDFEFLDDKNFDVKEYLQPAEALIRKIYEGIEEN